MSGSETLDEDATDDHISSVCGLAGCPPASQSPSNITDPSHFSPGGIPGSSTDITSGFSQPSDINSSSNFISDNNLVSSDSGLVSDGEINSDQIEHLCMHHHNHARCVNHTFDIGSSLTQINENLNNGLEIPIGVRPTFDNDSDDFEDPFAAVPADTTAADISAISLPLDSSILNIPKPGVISVISPSNPSTSSTSSSSSSSTSTSDDYTSSTSVVVGSFDWIIFSTTKNHYYSIFSYRPCITILVPELASRILLSFNLFQKSITLCFSLPPLF